MKINLHGWKPFSGQWYEIGDRPSVMNKIAEVLENGAKDAVSKALKDRYYSKPYTNADWFRLDGELAQLASEVLREQ